MPPSKRSSSTGSSKPRRPSLSRLDMDEAVLALLIGAMNANDHVSPEEGARAHNIIWSMRRFRRKSGRQMIDRARQRLHALATGHSQTWCDINEIVEIDRAYKAILQRAATHDTDLIVMGAQGRGSVELMLYGSNTQHVVRAATCPVLTVRA